MSRTIPLRLAPVVLALALVVASTSSGAASSDGFHTGDAQASADTLTLNLNAANATIGITAGRSLASYQDRTAQAEGRALDLGVLPLLLSGEQCDGLPGLLNADTLPPVTRTDSSEAGSVGSHYTQVFLPGEFEGPAGAPIGFQDVAATPTPSSRATTESAPLEVFLLSIDGGRTEVTTSLQGDVREAHAVATAQQLRILGGIFTFNQPRWEATARSGAQTAATGSFTFASASVLGVPKPAEEALADLQGFKESTEKFLAPLGVQFKMPSVEVREDGVRVTPMGFRIENPPFGAQVILPLLGQNSEGFESWRRDVAAQDCRNETFLTVVDVLVAALGGAGSIEVLAGGVDVATHDTDYSVPPIPELVVDNPPSSEPIMSDVMVDDSTYDLGDMGTYDDLGAFETSSVLSDAVALPAGAVPATTAGSSERTVLPAASLNRYEDSSAGSAGVVVGVLALLGALAMAIADRLRSRKALRRIV